MKTKTKTKTISDSAAAKMCKKLIALAVKKGVVMRPGDYMIEEEDSNGEIVYLACALGSIEHALAKGKAGYFKHDSLAKKMNHGISIFQLMELEDGFECCHRTKRKNTPLFSLGLNLRKKALAFLKKKHPDLLPRI